MRTFTQPAAAKNLTAWFVTAAPGQEIPNGKLSHADISGSPLLFRKVWKKLLRAAAFEAIGERTGEAASTPCDIAEVSAWLESAAAADSEEESLPPRTSLSTRKAKSQLRFETRDTTVAEPIHLSIFAQ